MHSYLDPVVLFFVLGAIAGIAKSELRIPASFYNTISIYLLLSIGIKGGIELFHISVRSFLLPAFGTLALGMLITYLAYRILVSIGKFDRNNAISIAAHYGSVSAVTFAVVISYLNDKHVTYEAYMTVLLVMLEVPALALGVFMAKLEHFRENRDVKKILHEVFLGKSVLLLTGGLLIGVFTAYSANKQLNFFFFDLFKGFLAIFMLEMGVVASERFKDLRKVGVFLIFFGVGMPVLSAVVGILMGIATGLSLGGTVVLATMAASASYIAAPAAMRLAIPEANPTYSITPALGITFPFNILVGIPLYHRLAEWLWQWV